MVGITFMYVVSMQYNRKKLKRKKVGCICYSEIRLSLKQVKQKRLIF